MTNLKNKLSAQSSLPAGRQGFTLIELLIVIAILGVLAVVVLLALNPVQQLARTRDAGRISGVTQLGHALEAFGTQNSGTYVPESATWITSLVTAGEIASVPGEVANTLTALCAVNVQNGYCYDASGATGTAPVLVFSRLEGASNVSRCTTINASWTQAYAAYHTGVGRGGILCGAAAPTVGGTLNWLP